MRCLPCQVGNHDGCQHQYLDDDANELDCLCEQCSAEQEIAARGRWLKRRREAGNRFRGSAEGGAAK